MLTFKGDATLGKGYQLMNADKSVKVVTEREQQGSEQVECKDAIEAGEIRDESKKERVKSGLYVHCIQQYL